MVIDIRSSIRIYRGYVPYDHQRVKESGLVPLMPINCALFISLHFMTFHCTFSVSIKLKGTIYTLPSCSNITFTRSAFNQNGKCFPDTVNNISIRLHLMHLPNSHSRLYCTILKVRCLLFSKYN